MKKHMGSWKLYRKAPAWKANLHQKTFSLFNASFVRNKTFKNQTSILSAESDLVMIIKSWLNDADESYIIHQSVRSTFSFVPKPENYSKGGSICLFWAELGIYSAVILMMSSLRDVFIW